MGQIYGYPEGGAYFGVTLTNFGGWFLVALVLIRVLQLLATRMPPSRFWDWGRRRFPSQALLGPAFYLGILGFNLAMTFIIGETCLGWVGIFIYVPFLTWLALKIDSAASNKGSRIAKALLSAWAARRLWLQSLKRSLPPPKISRQPFEGFPDPDGRLLVPGLTEKFRNLLAGRIGNGPEAQKQESVRRGEFGQDAGLQIQNRVRQGQTGARWWLPLWMMRGVVTTLPVTMVSPACSKA